MAPLTAGAGPGARESSPAPSDDTVQRAAVPPGFRFLAVAAICFIAVACAFSFAAGVPFVAPTEHVSPALGMPYYVPLAVSVAGYFAIQTVLGLLGVRGGSWRTRMRALVEDCYLIVLFAVVMYIHLHIKMWMPIINPTMFDSAYAAIDDALRPVLEIAEQVRADVVSVLPFADAWYQNGLLLMFALSFWLHAIGNRRWHYHNMTGILLVEMIGPLTYLIAPAVGPFIYDHGPAALATIAQQKMYDGFRNIQAQGIGWLADHGGTYFTAPPAAMPSLHIAAAAVMTYYAIRARFLAAVVMILLFSWIAIESVVLRWHYLVDLPAGLAVAALVIVITEWVCRAQPTPRPRG